MSSDIDLCKTNVNFDEFVYFQVQLVESVLKEDERFKRISKEDNELKIII